MSTAVGAGGVREPVSARLAEGRRRCRRITRENGTTYYWGTVFLPGRQREDVYAVYALCRLADDIVDEPDRPDVVRLGLDPSADPEARLSAFEARFHAACQTGDDADPVLLAVAHSVRRLGLARDVFDRFFAAMRLDLARNSWSSWEELREVYMEGSAAVVGEMMLPVLRPTDPAARRPARALGLAFQLTNFLRDVGEDLDRGRVYLPADELAAHGADPWQRRVTPQWRSFMAAQIDRNRRLYAEAEAGLELLPGASARCVGAALEMYSAILTKIEEADYDVFSTRHRVQPAAKVAIAARTVVTGRGRTAASHARPTGPSEPTGPGGAGARAPEGPAFQTTRVPVRRVPQPEPDQLRSTWREAAVPRIQRALRLALQKDPGGWYVVGASRDLKADRSIVRQVAGTEIALWRTADGQVRAGPGACPHMGARLDGCTVSGGDILCRWHGLRLPTEWTGTWPSVAAHDDGVLLWVRLVTSGESLSSAPRTVVRPPARGSLTAVHAQVARCQPEDIVANRLDPWHGAWFHPYAFSHLVVDDAESTDERLVTDVTFRLDRTWGVPVRAEFTCPDARSIVMTITQGEGAGSVVETHATPIGHDGRGLPLTVMTEATIATSERLGFRVARMATPLLRSLVVSTQARLWVDDLEYAERRYAVRTGRVGR